jgi:transcriptional regulator with XRE-family HTH domain
MSLGEFLKSKRESVGYSQGEVAKKLKYTSPQFISNWERGVSSPPIKVLKHVADLYKVSTDELFDLILKHSLEQLKTSLLREYGTLIKRKKSLRPR